MEVSWSTSTFRIYRKWLQKEGSDETTKWSSFCWDHYSNSKQVCPIKGKSLIVTEQCNNLFFESNWMQNMKLRMCIFFGSEKAPVLTTLEDLSAEEIKVLKEEVKDKHRLIKMATIECCKKWRRSDKNFQVLYWKEVVVGVIELYSNTLK